MRVVTANEVEVQVQTRVGRQCLKELEHQVGVEITHHRPADLDSIVEIGAAADIHDRPGEGVIKRGVGGGESLDSQVFPERLPESLSENDPDVLDEVVLVDVKVSLRLKLNPDTRMHHLKEGIIRAIRVNN